MHRVAASRIARTALLILLSSNLCALPVSASASAGKGATPGDAIFRDSMEEFLDIEGEARFLQPLAGATVTLVRPDAPTLTTTAGVDGRFAFRVELTTPQAVLEVRARGTGNQAHEEYASYLGQRDFLLERAGNGRMLDETALPALRLNPFSTAIYVAMRDLPASPLTPPGRDFQRRVRGINALDLNNRGPLIAMLAAGDLALPSGAATTLEAVSSPSLALQAQLAREQDTRGCPDNPVCIARERVGSDPTQLPLRAPPINAAIQLYLTFANGSSRTPSRLRLTDAGNGVLSELSALGTLAEVPVLISNEAGVSRITRPGGAAIYELVSFPFHPSCNCQVREVRASLAYRMLFAEGPDGSLLVGLAEEIERRYPDNPGIPTVAATISTPRVLFPADVGDTGLGGFANPAGSTLVLPTCLVPDCTVGGVSGNVFHSTQFVAFEPHRFNPDGSGSTARLNLAFTWQRSDAGRLQVAYSNGTQASWLPASADRLYGAVLGEFITVDQRRLPLTASYAIVRSPQGFTADAVAGRAFSSRLAVDYPYAILDPNSAERPGATAQRFGFTAGGGGTDPTANITLSWVIDPAGRLVFTRQRATPIANDSTYPQRRTWELIAEDVDSILILESVETPPQALPASPVLHPTARLFRYLKH